MYIYIQVSLECMSQYRKKICLKSVWTVSGLFTLHVPKETAGQHFEGLEMLTSLLAPKGSRSAKPLVEDTGEVSFLLGYEKLIVFLWHFFSFQFHLILYSLNAL